MPAECVSPHAESRSRFDRVRALHLCAATGAARILKRLLTDQTLASDLRMDINALSEDGVTALMLALQSGSSRSCRECIDTLLEHGADADIMDEHGNSALHIAVEASNVLRVAQLAPRCPRALRAARADRRTPLHLAVELRHVPMTQTLLEAGAPVSAAELPAECEPLLHVAIKHSTPAVVTLLLRRGVQLHDVDASGVTVLELAAERGDAPLVEELLRFGADACRGQALAAAAARAHVDTIMLLLSRAPSCGTDVLQLNAALCAVANAGHVHVARALLVLGASANARDRYNNTALQLAARRNTAATCELLLHAGAEREEQGSLGMSALAMARTYNCPAAAAVLVLQRADVGALRGRSQGRTFPQRLLVELGLLALSRRAAMLLARRRAHTRARR